MGMKSIIKVLFLLLMLTNSIKAEETEEENVVVITCGYSAWTPQSETRKSFLGNEFDLLAYDKNFLYAVDHRFLYATSKSSNKLIHKIPLKDPSIDWIYDIKIKNSILVITGFSANLQQTSIIRYKVSDSSLSKLDEYIIESTVKEDGDESNWFHSPLAINDKALFLIETRSINSVNIYKVLKESRDLISSHTLLNADLDIFDDFMLFADVFKHSIQFRVYKSNLNFDFSESDGYRAYKFINYEEFDQFNEAGSAYLNYFAYLSHNQINENIKIEPYSYLLTFDLVTEKYKVRPYKSMPASGWDVSLGYLNAENVRSNVFNIYYDNEDENEYRLELDSTWGEKRSISLLQPDGLIDFEYKAFGKSFFYISEYGQEGDYLNTQLFYLNDHDSQFNQITIEHSTNQIKTFGDYFLAVGNSPDGSFNLSLFKGHSMQLLTSMLLDDFVDVGAMDEMTGAIKLSRDKFIVPIWASYKRDAKKYDHAYEVSDEYNNGYQLLLVAVSKGKMQLITSLDMNIYNNDHCSSHCDEDPKEFWDNRRVITDGNQITLIKGSQIDILEFNKNFEYTHNIINLREANDSKSNDIQSYY